MTRRLDIDSLSTAFSEGLDPADVLREIAERIDRDGARPVWIAVVPGARIAARLEEIKRQRAGGKPLPLFGIPFAVKDNIDVAGLPTTAACPEFAYVPSRSATVVEKLEGAGAVLVGKTNLDQFATGLVGTRSPYGIPSSVFDARYISGGSSSGSAVAVAAGLVSFALGTDTAGSGRVPAAFNNIVGLKPSKGWLSARGVVPACRSLDCVSVFAGTVEDSLRVAQIAGGCDADDPFSRRMPANAASPRFPKTLRFGVPAELEFFGDEDAARLFANSVTRLERLGATQVAIDFTPFRDAARLLYAGPWVAERFAAIKSFATNQADAIHPVVREIVLGGQAFSATEAFEGLYQLSELKRRAEREWAKMDVMLLPTAGTTYTIEQVLADPIRLNSNLGFYTNFVNLMDLAAVAIPAGFCRNGLPFGVTLMGPAFYDDALALAADRLHRTLDHPMIGATGNPLPAKTLTASEAGDGDCMEIGVLGAHLSGQLLNYQLTERGARFLRTVRTASGYSLYALERSTPAKPGLVFDGVGKGTIEMEVWAVPSAAVGSFLAMIPPPLGIGTITLEDGSSVKGFLCEAHAVTEASDITHFGGWRTYLGQARHQKVADRASEVAK